MDATRVLDILVESECAALLASVPVGRVGVSVAAIPAVLPVNFVVDDGTVVFRTARGTKFDAAVVNAIVAFEVDGFDSVREVGWSVLVRGRATEITDPDELQRVRRLPLRSWTLDESADRYVRINSELVTGRRIVEGYPSTDTA